MMYIAIGMYRYRHIPNAIYGLYNVAPDDGLKSPKHEEHILKNKEN